MSPIACAYLRNLQRLVSRELTASELRALEDTMSEQLALLTLRECWQVFDAVRARTIKAIDAAAARAVARAVQ